MSQDVTDPGTPTPAFVFTGGCAPLDLVATVGRRRSPVPLERIPDRPALARWLTETGLVDRPPPVTVDELDDAWRLRESVYCLARTHLPSEEPTSAEMDKALTVLNEVAARPTLAEELVATRGGLRAQPRAGTAGEALSRIARQAITLFGRHPRPRIKECAHPDCSLLFLDETQAGRRRWCSMDRCGNLVKVAAYRTRHRSHPRRE